MNELEKHLRDATDDSQNIGLDFGATIGPEDVKTLTESLTRGVKIKGHYADDPEVTVTLMDVWRYYVGDELIEDESGAVHVTAKYGGQEASIILQWVHVNGGIAVDTDGDGK